MSDTKRLSFLLLFLCAALAVQAQTTGADRLRTALEQFSAGSYRESLLGLREIVLSEADRDLHGAAYFWMARSQMALENYDSAARDLEYFLDSYPESSFYDEGLYWKGRLLFLQNDFDNAIRVLYQFVETYPDHEYTANGYFWIAESLFSLGHLEKAQRIFNLVLTDYPASFKVEASRYRLSLIEMKEREEELMRLLKMSHEEYLFALEEFQRREKSYDQAIAGYQRKLTALTADDKEALVQELSREIETKDDDISALNRQVEQLKSRVSELTATIDELRRQIEEGGGSAPAAAVSLDSTATEREALLELKMDALLLKEFYIDWLLDQQEGR